MTSFNSKTCLKDMHTYANSLLSTKNKPGTIIDPSFIDYSNTFTNVLIWDTKNCFHSVSSCGSCKASFHNFQKLLFIFMQGQHASVGKKAPAKHKFSQTSLTSFFVSSIYFFCLYVSCVFGVTTTLKVLIGFFVFLFDRKSQKRSTRLRWHMRKLQ